jgi:hypothetical protein
MKLASAPNSPNLKFHHHDEPEAGIHESMQQNMNEEALFE